MSRFPGAVRGGDRRGRDGREAAGRASWPSTSPQHILERQQALRAEVKIRARYPLDRHTPVTGLQYAGARDADRARDRVTGRDAARRSASRRPGINACPCAQGLVRERAAGRLERGRLRRGRHRAHPRARPARHPQPARPRDARHRNGARLRRRGARRAGGELDELSDLRAAEAARRAVRRRARASAAALRRGLGAPHGRAGDRRAIRTRSATATSSSPARSTSRRSTTTRCSRERCGTVGELRAELATGEPLGAATRAQGLARGIG